MAGQFVADDSFQTIHRADNSVDRHLVERKNIEGKNVEWKNIEIENYERK